MALIICKRKIFLGVQVSWEIVVWVRGILFHFLDCDCDVGGSVHNVCDKVSGQCLCHSRVNGRTCKEPLKTHYFPTLYQYQYEVEDGRTPANTKVRYANDERVFPEYSWKGYAVFGPLQVLYTYFYNKLFYFNQFLLLTNIKIFTLLLKDQLLPLFIILSMYIIYTK